MGTKHGGVHQSLCQLVRARLPTIQLKPSLKSWGLSEGSGRIRPGTELPLVEWQRQCLDGENGLGFGKRNFLELSTPVPWLFYHTNNPSYCSRMTARKAETVVKRVITQSKGTLFANSSGGILKLTAGVIKTDRRSIGKVWFDDGNSLLNRDIMKRGSGSKSTHLRPPGATVWNKETNA